jgi:hypothetical protein
MFQPDIASDNSLLQEWRVLLQCRGYFYWALQRSRYLNLMLRIAISFSRYFATEEMLQKYCHCYPFHPTATINDLTHMNGNIMKGSNAIV